MLSASLNKKHISFIVPSVFSSPGRVGRGRLRAGVATGCVWVLDVSGRNSRSRVTGNAKPRSSGNDRRSGTVWKVSQNQSLARDLARDIPALMALWLSQ